MRIAFSIPSDVKVLKVATAAGWPHCSLSLAQNEDTSECRVATRDRTVTRKLYSRFTLTGQYYQDDAIDRRFNMTGDGALKAEGRISSLWRRCYPEYTITYFLRLSYAATTDFLLLLNKKTYFCPTRKSRI